MRIRADTARDIMLIRTRFIDVCKQTPNVDVTCYEDNAGASGARCRQLVRDMLARVLAR